MPVPGFTEMKNPQQKIEDLAPRVGIVVPLLLVGVFALLLPFLFRHRLKPAAAPDVLSISTTSAPTSRQSRSANDGGQTIALETHVQPQAMPVAVPDETISEDALADQLEQLQNLAMSDSPNALSMITSELGNADPRIRNAAREAAIQFGDQSAIPALEVAITLTEDPLEKVFLRNAIEFLQLPSLTEFAKQSQ